MDEHDALIERLAREARPVRRLPAPSLRTAGWMAAALPCGFLASLLLPRGSFAWSGPGAPWAALGLAASLALAALAIRTAFALSIAGERPAHGRWLAAAAAVWLLAALAGVTGSPDPVGHLGDGVYCYTFMLVAGLPMSAVVVAALRRTRALHPAASLAMAGLGIGALAQLLLVFCHPVAGELFDLGMHVAAAATLVALTVLGGRRWVRL